MVKQRPRSMTAAELDALPVTVDLPTAGRAFGLSREQAYELNQAGQFPCPVLKVGQRYRVPRHAILAALGVDTGGGEAA